MIISRNLCWALACLCMLANAIAARQLPQPERRTNRGVRGAKSAQLDSDIRQLQGKDDKKMGPCGMDTCHPSETPSLQPSPEPTSEPTSEATSSSAPSPTPSTSPTPAPTPSPTDQPSATPSKSPTIAPSPTPSTIPTPAPTPSPSDQPSPAPSTSPSSKPSPTPSISPTQAPTPSPSDQPSPAPSTSPSSKPSPTPSISPAPSSNPSAHPSRIPSSTPTLAPSVSAAPSPQIWDLQTINGYDNSTCIVLPSKPINSRTVLSSLNYVYSMYLPDEDNHDQAQKMAYGLEPKLHLALARKALTCTYLDPNLDFYPVGISAANEETVSGRCPDQPLSCWNVTGSIQVEVYYPSGNRRLDDAAVRDKYIEIMKAAVATLVDDVTVLDIRLQSFTSNVLATTIYKGVDDPNDPNYNGFASPDAPSTSDGGTSFGPVHVIIGLAGAAFVVMVGLLTWRGRRRREAYLQHMDEIDDLSLEESVKEAMDRREFVVHEDDGDESLFEDTVQKIQNKHEQNHDFRKCAAATCKICSEREPRPIFIATELKSIKADVRAELGPQRYSSRRGHGSMDDTVIL